MQVDFYQLGGTPPEQVIASLAEKLLGEDGRLLIVAGGRGAARAARPHAVGPGAGELPAARPRRRHRRCAPADPAVDQPRCAQPRPQHADRRRRVARGGADLRPRFYLFDAATLEGARLAWKLLAGREGVERRYWAQEDGKWVQQGLRLAARAAARLGGAANSNPTNYRRPPGHGRDAHLFDHQARCHPPQPHRRGHQDAGGGRPARRRFASAST